MMRLLAISSLLFLQLFSASAKVNKNLQNNSPGSDIQPISKVKLLKTGLKGSKLYQIDSDNSIYDNPPYLLNLAAGLSSFDQGFDNGYLLGDSYIENYDSLMKALLGDSWWEPVAQALLGKFLDYQWNNYLSKQLPQEYLDEISGITEGGRAAEKEGMKTTKGRDIGKIAGWGIVLANFPSDLPNLKFIIEDEVENPPTSASSDPAAPTKEEIAQLTSLLSPRWKGLSCSMFGVWGSRTENGKLFTGRNLDWFKDTGIATYKLITIHRPVSGFAHATFGFAGIWGALTGISSQGLTVHEANLESNDITFRGFPWVTRLRYAMSYASTIDEAMTLWNKTQNTVGYNHGFGSAKDGQAVVLETMKGNTALFYANDPREQDLVVFDEQIGLAREEAIFRTNHGYDSYTIQHYMWNTSVWYNNSILRYTIFPEMFDNFQTTKVSITYVEAVSVT
jgi:hypothetical protein